MLPPSYCHHLGWLSSVIFSNFQLLNGFGWNLAWLFLHKAYASIIDLLKNIAAVTKNRTHVSDSSFVYISKKNQVKPNSDMGYDEIYLWSNFEENVLTHVGVIDLFRLFLPLNFLMLLLLKIISSETTVQNSIKVGMIVSLGIVHKTIIWIYDLWKTWLPLRY